METVVPTIVTIASIKESRPLGQAIFPGLFEVGLHALTRMLIGESVHVLSFQRNSVHTFHLGINVGSIWNDEAILRYIGIECYE